MAKEVEKLSLHGIFHMNVYRKGKLIETYCDNNLVVDLGKEQMARLIAGDVVGRSITHIAFGTNDAKPVATDSMITNQWTKQFSEISYPKSNCVRFSWILHESENNGMAIAEFGLLTADGKLFARKLRKDGPLLKASDVALEGRWDVQFNS